jgi:hypothetical protein
LGTGFEEGGAGTMVMVPTPVSVNDTKLAVVPTGAAIENVNDPLAPLNCAVPELRVAVPEKTPPDTEANDVAVIVPSPRLKRKDTLKLAPVPAYVAVMDTEPEPIGSKVPPPFN